MRLSPSFANVRVYEVEIILCGDYMGRALIPRRTTKMLLWHEIDLRSATWLLVKWTFEETEGDA